MPLSDLKLIEATIQLGGTGGYDDGQYVLGDEALACLRDLKRWLKLYDEKTNRLDVARVLAERNLVKGDLLEILAAWSAEEAEDRLKSRVALACREFNTCFQSTHDLILT